MVRAAGGGAAHAAGQIGSSIWRTEGGEGQGGVEKAPSGFALSH